MTKELRTSAKKIHRMIFDELELHQFIYWCGYLASGKSNSVSAMSRALAQYCTASNKSIQRWITGEAKPNGTHMLAVYGGVMAEFFDGNQNLLMYEFLGFQDVKLRDRIFI